MSIPAWIAPRPSRTRPTSARAVPFVISVSAVSATRSSRSELARTWSATSIASTESPWKKYARASGPERDPGCRFGEILEFDGRRRQDGERLVAAVRFEHRPTQGGGRGGRPDAIAGSRLRAIASRRSSCARVCRPAADAASPARSSRSACSAGSVVTVSAWSRNVTACSCEPRAAARSAAARSAIRAWPPSASASGPSRTPRTRRGSGPRGRRRARRRRATRSSARRRGGGPGGRACARVVGDLADERLDEARTGRARASADRVSQRRAARAGRGRAAAARARPRSQPDDGREAGQGEALAEHGGVLERAPGRPGRGRRGARR